jgi:hypothetical protein
MTRAKTMVLLLITIGLFSCANTQDPQKQLIGKWKMVKIYEGEKDVSSQHNPKNNRWIKFNRNGSFESGGDPQGPNEGEWEFDVKTMVLFIDSKKEDDDSEWKIAFEDDKMIYKGIGTQRQESFKLISKKVN